MNPNKPPYWDEAKHFLSQKDPKLGEVLNRYDEHLKKSNNAFEVLLKAINGQQISVAAAAAIWERINNRFKPLTPENVMKLRPEDLASVGQSRQKSGYFINAAKFFTENEGFHKYGTERYEEVEKKLIDIKGVGSWTVEMYAIFYLNHPDIFPVKDIGLLRGMETVFGKKFDGVAAEKFGRRWKPYRTVATWYLWRVLDPIVIQY